MMKEYSKRLGAISPEQFQAALERVGLGDFVCAEAVSSGLFGQNVFVTSTQGGFVLRGAPHYPWQFPTERFFVERMHEQAQVPVPYPYLLASSTDVFGWSFAVMPRLAGVSVIDETVASQLAAKDKLAIAQAMARMLVEMQALTWEYAGKYDPETGSVYPFDGGYRAWVVACIRTKLDKSLGYNDHTTASDARWAESIVTEAAPAFDSSYQPCVVHADFGEHNVVLLRKGGWQVSGVFDWMTAHVGDGAADLSMSVAMYLRRDTVLADAFVNEYLGHKPMPSGFVELQRLYMLDLKLSFWEYWQREKGRLPQDETGALSFAQWAGPSVTYWEKYR
ncbi:MAG: aminoglycoside phosphotransferase family protein [Anaerolineae bacterium]|nr:aminoglycoside phosphotransferase family protein [Anaerolineae bacterium]